MVGYERAPQRAVALGGVTLVTCWVRRNRTVREVVVAADSRVSGGESWDSCPKIVVLPRPSTVMAMSGEVGDSHTFVVHAINSCHLLDGHTVGRTDIRYLANQLHRVFDDNRKHVGDLPVGTTVPRVPDVHLALVGWSWRRTRFELYTYRFNADGRVVHDSQAIDGVTKSSFFMGDAAAIARKRLTAINRAARAEAQRRAGPGVRLPIQSHYDWEPLDVLLQLVGDSAIRSVGGHPQVARIYQSGLTEQFLWKDDDDVESFGGRPVLDTERSDRRVMRARRTGNGMQIEVRFSDRSIARATRAEVEAE
jgi:hypothetical protein